MLVLQPEDMPDLVSGDPSLGGFVAGVILARAHAQLISVRSVVPTLGLVAHRGGATPGLIWQNVNHQRTTWHFRVPQ